MDATSTFLVPADDPACLDEVLAWLADRGLVIMEVRRVPERAGGSSACLIHNGG